MNDTVKKVVKAEIGYLRGEIYMIEKSGMYY